MLSTAEKVPLSRKVIFVTWSKPTPRQVQMERFLSPLLKRLGGCQGLAAAATGWLSDEGQRWGTATRDSHSGVGATAAPSACCHPGTGTEKAPRGCCPSSKGAQSSGSSAVHANLSSGGGIAQRKLGEGNSGENKSLTGDSDLREKGRLSCTCSKRLEAIKNSSEEGF